MFERFTEDARHAVRLAQEEARRLRHGFIGPEHLLLGLLAQRAGPAGGALAAAGLEITCLRHRIIAEADDPLDAAALASLGIDLETVRRTTEAAFGPGALDRGRRRRGKTAGHIPLSRTGKRRCSSRCARRSGSSTATSQGATFSSASCAEETTRPCRS